MRKSHLFGFIFAILVTLSPQFSNASVVYIWFAQDGSSSSGQLIIDAPVTGGFKLSQSSVTSFEFIFAPGLTVSLGEWSYKLSNEEIVSLDGRFLDGGVYDLSSSKLGISAFNTFIVDSSGPDVSQYDPSGQDFVVRGRWVREDIQNPAIDIYPAKDPNIINLKSRGFVSVAILTEGAFDALQVDPDSAKFGPSEATATRYKTKDVDRDGDVDMVLYFRIQQIGVCMHRQAVLTGTLYNRKLFIGVDSIQTKHCSTPG